MEASLTRTRPYGPPPTSAMRLYRAVRPKRLKRRRSRADSARPSAAALLAILALGFLWHDSAALGFPVTWDFAGQITDVIDDDGVLGGAVVVGSEFFGSFTFESSTPDQREDDPTFGRYENALSAISGQVADLAFTGPAGPINRVLVEDGLFHPGRDALEAHANVLLLNNAVSIRVSFVDGTGSLFETDALPLLVPSLNALESARFTLFSEDELFRFALQGDITLLVPEPSSLVLLGGAAMALCTRRRIRRPRIRTN